MNYNLGFKTDLQESCSSSFKMVVNHASLDRKEPEVNELNLEELRIEVILIFAVLCPNMVILGKFHTVNIPC